MPNYSLVLQNYALDLTFLLSVIPIVYSQCHISLWVQSVKDSGIFFATTLIRLSLLLLAAYQCSLNPLKYPKPYSRTKKISVLP